MGGGGEGREVILGRHIKWSGIIYLVVREGGRGDYTNGGGVRGRVFGAEAASVLGLRVIRGGCGVYIKAGGAREAS